MRHVCSALILLSLVLVSCTRASALWVTPGGIRIQGTMLWEEWAGNDWPSGPKYWTTLVLNTPSEYDHQGDPTDRMYTSNMPYGPQYGELGVRPNIYSLVPGTYEHIGAIMLGHKVYAFDFTVTGVTTGTWEDSDNLVLELRHFNPDYNTVYWSHRGPFSSTPFHVSVELPQGEWGYEFRLRTVPDPSPFAVVLTGLGGLLLRSRKRLR